MSDNFDVFNFNTGELFTFIARKKRPLLIVTLAALILSTLAAFIITPKFRASVIIFPTATTSVSNSLLNTNLPKKELLNFGKDEEVEQMLQILQSDEIRDRIVKKYNLMEHYGIDKNDEYPQTELDDEYKNNITFTRTEFLSIEIEVLDKNKVFAANIANDIASLVDTVVNNMLHERAVKALQLVEQEYLKLKAHKRVLEDSLKFLQGKGVFHYESQSEVLNAALGEALASQKMKGVELIEEKLKILAEYGSAYMAIRDLLVYEAEKLSILESKYSEAKVDAEQKLPHKYVVNKASVPEKKAYPIRWLIVVLSTTSAFFLALFLLILTDRLKKKVITK